MTSQSFDGSQGLPPVPPEAAPQEVQPEQGGGSDTLLGWLALYLPAYGTSVLLHVSAGLIAWFLSWQVQPVAADVHFTYTSAAVAENKVKIETKKKTITKVKVKFEDKDKPKGKAGAPGNPNDKPSTGRGKYKPGPSSIAREFTDNPFPDVAANNLQQLDVIGVGSGGNHIGGFEGLGSGRAGFFGAGGENGGGGDYDEGPRKMVYIVDRSGSMSDSMDYVKMELKRSISELDDEREFHVIFFSSGPPVEMPTRRLVNATERNKQMAFEFIDSVVAQGETDPSKALERAFSCQPELIYLLTDGEFDRQIIDLVKRLNTGNKVTVHTIGFVYRMGEDILKQIAQENNGNYKFVSEADLANMSR
jgi:hypothetical protein